MNSIRSKTRFSSYEEDEELDPIIKSKMPVHFFNRIIKCFTISQKYFLYTLIVITFYLIHRIFYELNVKLIDSKQIHESVSTTSNDFICQVSNEVNYNFNELFISKLEEIRKENQQLNSLISKLKHDYVSVQKFEIALKDAYSEHESFMEYIQNFILNELNYLRIKGLGKPDFALKEIGSKVIEHSKTHEYGGQIVRWQGLPLFFDPKSPDIVISKSTENIVPGNCWPFNGNIGFLTIKLYRAINVTSISYEHVSSKLLPFDEMKSAPKFFEIWVGKNEDASYKVGNFEFKLLEIGVEIFNLPEPVPARFVKIFILENYGDKFTCLYRIRVHGIAI